MVARMRINGDPAIMLALFSSVFRLLKCSNYAGHNRRKPNHHTPGTGADLEHNLGGGGGQEHARGIYWPSQRGKVQEGVPFSVRSAEALTFF